MKVILLIPTLNEIEGVKTIMPQIKKEWVDEIVFVDGNSTDGTLDYIKEHSYPLVLEKRKGVRYAFLEALEKTDCDVIITFSPDGNCIPELIPNLIEKIKEGYDMVIASRYKGGATSRDDTAITGFGNWMFPNLINTLFHSKYTDTLGIYRIYKKNLIKDLDLDKEGTYPSEVLFNERGMGWEMMLSLRAAKKKLKVTEIPGPEPARIGGKTKLKVFKWGAILLIELLKEIFVWR